MAKYIRFSILALVFMLACLAVSPVQAAPLHQEPVPQTITGTITQLEIVGDPSSGTATVLVTLLDDLGTVSTVEITWDYALTLGLVIANPDGTNVINVAMIGTVVLIDPTMLVEGETNKVAIALANFFGTIFGTDAATIMAYHEEGVGFGVIAQAGFMSLAMNGDGTLFEAVLLAKQTGDFSAIVLPDGTIAENWGQLRKAVLTNNRSLNNLGAIMSGRANKETGNTASPEKGNKKDKDKGKNK